MKKYFITFGGGNEMFKKAGTRLLIQAMYLNIFTKCKLYTEEDLSSDIEFWEQHKDFIEQNVKGYGLGIWKPYIIKKKLEETNEGDCIFFLDMKNELHINKKKNLINCFKKINDRDMLAFSNNSIEKHYTKPLLFEEMDLVDTKYMNTYQVSTNAIMLINNAKTRQIINEWYDLSCNYELLNDNVKTTTLNFKRHNNEQSIFSLLVKKYDIKIDNLLSDSIYHTFNLTSKTNLEKCCGRKSF